MVKVITNSQGKVYVANGKALLSDSGTKYGVSINNILGGTDNSGVLQLFSTLEEVNFSGVTNFYANVLRDTFRHKNVRKALFPDVVNITFLANHSLSNTFTESTLEIISFPLLTTVEGSYVFEYLCYNCSNLSSVEFPELTTVSASNSFSNAFAYS